MNNSGRWSGQVAYVDGNSYLRKSAQRAPLKVAKPFRTDDGGMSIYLMDASAGLFNGDEQVIECVVEAGASLYLTNQSSSKIHPSLSPHPSRQVQRFRVMEGALLEYLPEPLVPFRDANYVGDTIVQMEAGAQAFVTEVITPGRVARGEQFAYKRLRSTLSVYWGSRLAAWDTLNLEPRRHADLTHMLGGYTHVGTLWILSERVAWEHLDLLQGWLFQHTGEHHLYGGVSMLQNHGIVVRVLGHSVQRVQAVLLSLWPLVRREVFGRDPIVVRK
ncbi:MAG: hypothetical protein A2201_09275 [Alicyclobacillus sp. RIFOXYA1_FULL_53_8]|nr:MAG: hypothetical protein A2201_09275 [Alicyclobacillus sp. RIFOXYA1_FULL_53_8]